MSGRTGQNILDDSFREFSGTLILLLDNAHAPSDLDIFPFGVHFQPSIKTLKRGRPAAEIVQEYPLVSSIRWY
jgi:hypothetical protein